jgi:hypothetical protein
MTAETRWYAADNSRANISSICAPHLTSSTRPAAAQNGSVRVSPDEGLLRSVARSGTGSADGVPDRQSPPAENQV